MRTTASQTESRFWQGMDSLLAQPYGKLTGHLADSVRESRSDVGLVRIFEEVHANAFLIQFVWKCGRNLGVPPESASYEHFVHNLIRRRPIPGLTDDNRRVKLRAGIPEANKDIATMTNCEYLSSELFEHTHPAETGCPESGTLLK